MHFLILLVLLPVINCNLSDDNVVNNHTNNKNVGNRFKKCSGNGNFGSFLGKAFNIFESEEEVYLNRRFNVSECTKNRNGSEDREKHIFDGILIHHEVPHAHWLDYKSIFDKVYETHRDEMSALSQWRKNLKLVADHNRRFLAGEISYSLQLNQFGDWHPEEYFKNILKLFDTLPLFDPALDLHRSHYRRNAHKATPNKIDWRAIGFTPKREEQWQCGACYAFAVTHAVQAQLYKKHGQWGELSPQQIVDCSAVDGNEGCDGGSLRGAFRYAARSGLVSEQYYPYTGKKGNCKSSSLFSRTKPRSWSMLPVGDEGAMEKALATIGPLAVGVNAAPFTFQLYRSGIYDDPFCVPWGLNHAMLLVGYTPEYWILLNWWGKKWGEDGYIRIRRGFNRCGVANMAAYVVV